MGAALLHVLVSYVLPLVLLLLAIWGVARWMRAGSADPADSEIP